MAMELTPAVVLLEEYAMLPIDGILYPTGRLGGRFLVMVACPKY